MRTRVIIVAVAAILLTMPIAATADFVNVALNKPVSASSVYDPSYGEASNAVDGDFNTMWGSSAHGTPANPQWLIVDMGQDYSIDRITLTLASGYPGLTNIYNLYGKASLATDWSLIGSGTLTDTTDPQDQWLANGDSMRYLKHEVIGGTHWAQLLELEAFAVPEPATLSLLALGGLALIRRRKPW